jgi:hypothetical protein
MNEFSDKRTQRWTQQGLTILVDATEAYMVEAIAESHMLMQQLISSRYLVYLQLSQGKKIGYC